jgi:four helix bundle protein
MAKAAFETLEIYQLSESLADLIWDMAITWNHFARDTVRKQIVRAADSIGANISEGFGRGTTNDQRYFLRIARGSLNETTHFLRRLYRRKLLNDKQISTLRPIMDTLGPKLNAYLGSVSRRVRALPKRSRRRQTGTTNNKPQTTNV